MEHLLQRANGNRFGFFNHHIHSFPSVTAAQVLTPLLQNMTTYYWQVMATGPGGISPWSNGWSFTTGAAAPTLSTPVDGAINQPVTLSLVWNGLPGATSYGMQVSTSSVFASTVLTQSGLSSPTTVVTLPSATTYYWHANAGYLSLNSSWSSTWAFTTITNISVPLLKGWNMISFNVRLADSGSCKVFGDSTSHANRHCPKGCILVKDCLGKVYWPTQDINDLAIINTGSGYQMYTDSTDTIRTGGAPVPLATTSISIAKGWNLIGYLPTASVPVNTALSNITSIIYLVKNNLGFVYWPDYGVNDIGAMSPGQGYFMYTKAAGALTYASSKQLANSSTLLSLPTPHHFTLHANTGSNASVLASSVVYGTQGAANGFEIAAFDNKGNCVGAGSVIQGRTAFAVWGDDINTKAKDGCSEAEPLTFTLWDGSHEYPVEFVSADGSAAKYTTQGIIAGRFKVLESSFITAFDLSRAWPNPFRGMINIAFDVPHIGNESSHAVEIAVYNVNGVLVQELAKGNYKPGRYTVSWNSAAGKSVTGPGMYIVRMKAQNFDKRIKLICVR